MRSALGLAFCVGVPLLSNQPAANSCSYQPTHSGRSVARSHQAPPSNSLIGLADSCVADSSALPPIHDHRAPAVRRRRRLVREPVEPSQPARRDPRAHVAAGRARPKRASRSWTTSCGTTRSSTSRGTATSSSATPRCRGCASICMRGGFLHVERQLRARRELPPRDQARLSRPAARRRAADASDLSRRLRLPERAAEDPRARRQAGARVRHLPRRPARGVLRATRAISGTAGRIPRSTTIRRRCTKRRCAWA